MFYHFRDLIKKLLVHDRTKRLGNMKVCAWLYSVYLLHRICPKKIAVLQYQMIFRKIIELSTKTPRTFRDIQYPENWVSVFHKTKSASGLSATVIICY